MPGVKEQLVTKDYSIYCGDSCQVIKDLPDESVGFIVYSPPFAELYSYSDADEDMGNSRTYKEFFEHYRYLARELFRVLMPGRLHAIHCMDLPMFKSKGEDIGLKDFPGDIVRMMKKIGFVPFSHHCIWKDPLIAATRTKAIGLAHKQIVKDSAFCRMGTADYIWAFRKPGENPKPIEHPEGLTEYPGSTPIPSNLDRFNFIHPITGEPWSPKTNKRSHWIWQKIASPVWMDIRQGRVLPYKAGRDKDDQKHVCPLQLDTIERCLILWSAPGDIVLSPFMGCGTEVYVAVGMGRKGVGIELKLSYWKQARANLEMLKLKHRARKLVS